MNLSSVFARVVAVIGAAALQWRRLQGVPPEAAWGSAPVVPEAKPQGVIPTLKMPTAQGWARDRSPLPRLGWSEAEFGIKFRRRATGCGGLWMMGMAPRAP